MILLRQQTNFSGFILIKKGQRQNLLTAKTIAHRFLTLSLVHYLAGMVNADKPPIPSAQRLINYGLNKVRFPHPVSPGENISAHVEVISVK